MKIVITGSLGNIGRPLTKELVQKGHAVTVISSNPQKQNDIEALGATPAIGSLEDANFIQLAFAGADAVYAMVPPNYTAPNIREYYGRIGANYAQAITKTGVKRVVHLSSYGAHLDSGTGIILGAHDVENILNKLTGVAVTHLRPAYFYYNLLHFTAMIKLAGFIGSNYGGDDKLVMVAPADIAAVGAQELQQMPDAGNNVRYIASDDVTANEAARILGTAIGKPDLKWVTLTNQEVLAGMIKNGMPAPFAADFTDLGASIHSGAMREDYDLHKPATMGKIKLVDFTKEFAAAYNK